MKLAPWHYWVTCLGVFCLEMSEHLDNVNGVGPKQVVYGAILGTVATFLLHVNPYKVGQIGPESEPNAAISEKSANKLADGGNSTNSSCTLINDMSNEVATLTVTSAEFANPLTFAYPVGTFPLPFSGDCSIVASSPAGKLAENVVANFSVDGLPILVNKPVASFPIDLPGAFGVLAPVIEAIDATITLDVKAS